MKDQAEEVTQIVECKVAFQESMKAHADKTAIALVQAYLGPDHKMVNMAGFHSGLRRSDKLESRTRSINQVTLTLL